MPPDPGLTKVLTGRRDQALRYYKPNLAHTATATPLWIRYPELLAPPLWGHGLSPHVPFNPSSARFSTTVLLPIRVVRSSMPTSDSRRRRRAQPRAFPSSKFSCDDWRVRAPRDLGSRLRSRQCVGPGSPFPVSGPVWLIFKYGNE